MKTWIATDSDGRILSSTTEEEYSEGMTEIDVPDDFDFDHQDDYIYKDGLLSYSQRPPEAPDPEIEMSLQITAAIPMIISMMAPTLSDDQVTSIPGLMPEWSPNGVTYHTGDVVRYHGALYRALQDSTSIGIYPPDTSVSLWKAIGEPDDEGIFPWVQPLGDTDAYGIGDKVTHNGKTWVSSVDTNVWEPGVYGWDEVAE